MELPEGSLVRIKAHTSATACIDDIGTLIGQLELLEALVLDALDLCSRDIVLGVINKRAANNNASHESQRRQGKPPYVPDQAKRADKAAYPDQ